MTLSIEMDDRRGGDYSSIHAVGCRDLRDGERLPGAPATVADVVSAVRDATGWSEEEYDTDSVILKPCAREAMRKGA